MPRKKEEPLPSDIAAMTLEEVKAAYEATQTKQHHLLWEEYCEQRDYWQSKMLAHSKRTFDLLRHYNTLMQNK